MYRVTAERRLRCVALAMIAMVLSCGLSVAAVVDEAPGAGAESSFLWKLGRER